MSDMEQRKRDLRQKQSLPLECKIILTQQRIREWYDHWEGQVCVSFSGGKDSTVLKHLVETTSGVYDVPSVFVNTGLEFPEIRTFAMSQPNVVTVYPEMRFDKVVDTYGYPVIGKRQARYIRDLQNASENNRATVNLRLTGYNQDGKYCPSMKLANKWVFLKDAPFKISDQCCDVMKKRPLKAYQKETGRKPIIGTMTCESSQRERQYLRNGCNAFNQGTSQPMSFWTDQDVLAYILKYNLDYASVYGDIVCDDNGDLYTTGESRTGCMFCAFGIALDGCPNRFQRMKGTHPPQYAFCMKPRKESGLGMRDVLEYIGVPYE